jgi:hypothetical protein
MIGRIGNYVIGILLGTAAQSASASRTRLVMAFLPHFRGYPDMPLKAGQWRRPLVPTLSINRHRELARVLRQLSKGDAGLLYTNKLLIRLQLWSWLPTRIP